MTGIRPPSPQAGHQIDVADCATGTSPSAIAAPCARIGLTSGFGALRAIKPVPPFAGGRAAASLHRQGRWPRCRVPRHSVLDLFRTTILWFRQHKLEDAMDHPDATTNLGPVRVRAKRTARHSEHRLPQPCLEHGQRWLARATAVAVLLSGLNASVQVWKAGVEHHGQQWEQRPQPGRCPSARQHR